MVEWHKQKYVEFYMAYQDINDSSYIKVPHQEHFVEMEDGKSMWDRYISNCQKSGPKEDYREGGD